MSARYFECRFCGEDCSQSYQGGRRMETAMDACDKIMGLCELPTTDLPDKQREAPAKEYRPLFGLTAEEKEVE